VVCDEGASTVDIFEANKKMDVRILMGVEEICRKCCGVWPIRPPGYFLGHHIPVSVIPARSNIRRSWSLSISV